MTRPALCLLAALALLLARRRPAWRPFALSLAALACIDVARLWTSPLAQTRAQPWWGLDVALVALWPVVLGVGLLPTLGRRVLGRPFDERLAAEGEPPPPVVHDVAGHVRLPDPVGGQFVHAPILPRLLALAAFAIAIGAARPWLPRLAYLSALRLPRWALAALWVEAIVRLKDEGPRPKPEPLPPTACRRGNPSPPPDGRGDHGENAETTHFAHDARLAQACALILAGCNAADLLAGAWLVPPWEAPAWGYARAVTWAAYGAVALVMLAACRRRA